MDNTNYIIKNIAMLKNNTINVKNLTNKFCLELSRNFGIERTLELENTISELLTKYKSGEIDDNIVIQNFDEILNTPNVVNTAITSNNNNSNGNVGNKNSKYTVTNNSVSKDVSKSSTSKNVEDTSKGVNNHSNLENTVKIIEEKDDNDVVEVLDNTNELENKKIIEKNKEDIKEKLNNASSVSGTIVNKETLNDSEVVNDIKENDNTKLGVTTVNVIDKDSVDEKVLNPIVDIEPNNLADVASICESISGELSGLKITPPAKALPYASGIMAAAAAITNVSSDLDGFKSIVLSTITGAEENDVDYADGEEPDWGDIRKLIYDKESSHEVREATAKFFEDCGCEINNGIVTLKSSDGKTYEYDLNSKTLYITKSDGTKTDVKATIYVPDGVTDYSKLNAYTYFTSKSNIGNSSKKYNERIEDEANSGRPYKANAILIRIDKGDVQRGGKDPKTREDFVKQEEVADMTKFINGVAKTQLDTGYCRNIVAGDSVYGSHAIQLKADNKGLYQTVFCIDNAVLVPYNNDEIPLRERVPGIYGNCKIYDGKEQMTWEQIKNLNEDGGDIYFISVNGDPNYSTYSRVNVERGYENIDVGGKNPSKEQYKMSFTYTGMEILGAHCPKVNTHIVYQEYHDNGTVRENLATAIDELASVYKNITDDSEYYPDFARVRYYHHSQGNEAVTDALESPVVSGNHYYNNGFRN